MIPNIHKAKFFAGKVRVWQTGTEKEILDEMQNVAEWTLVCAPFNDVIKGEIKRLNSKNQYRNRMYEANFIDTGALIYVYEYPSLPERGIPSVVGEYLILRPN